MDRGFPALFALGIALLLILSPLYVLPTAGQPVYSHNIEQVSHSEVPEEAKILQYENLSSEAKAAVLDARNDDGYVYGEANKPPEFFYSDYAQVNQGIYYVQQDGTYYQVVTHSVGSLVPVYFILRWSLVIFGLGVGLIGYVSLRDSRRWLPVAFGILGGLLLIVVAFGGRESVPGIRALVLLLLTLGGIVSAFVGFGATFSR